MISIQNYELLPEKYYFIYIICDKGIFSLNLLYGIDDLFGWFLQLWNSLSFSGIYLFILRAGHCE